MSLIIQTTERVTSLTSRDAQSVISHRSGGTLHEHRLEVPIRDVCVRDNILAWLHDDLCELRELETLTLSHNKLLCLRLSLVSLREVYCNNNRITDINLNLPNLEILEIQHNELTEWTHALPQLRRLNMNHNPLTYVNLAGCEQLEYVACKFTKPIAIWGLDALHTSSIIDV